MHRRRSLSSRQWKLSGCFQSPRWERRAWFPDPATAGTSSAVVSLVAIVAGHAQLRHGIKVMEISDRL